MTEKLKEILEESTLGKLQKNVVLGTLKRAFEEQGQRLFDIGFIRTISKQENISEIVFSDEGIKIYKVRARANASEENWDVKYPYRFIYLKDGKWEGGQLASPTFETCFLNFLSEKYQGNNSQFAQFAVKMLEMP
jgi:hypothetical protein